MEAIGSLFIHGMYIMFFIIYFAFTYSLYGYLVFPYFSINMVILIIEFFTLNGSHTTFVISIIFNLIFLMYIILSIGHHGYTKDKKILLMLPIITLVPYALIPILIYGSKLKIILPYLLFNNSYFLLSLVILITLVIILFKIEILNKYTIGLILFIYSILVFQILSYNIEKQIKDISIKKFGIPPQCLNINFDIHGNFKHPHALVKKNGNYYYWSFRKNKFIQNNRIQGC